MGRWHRNVVAAALLVGACAFAPPSWGQTPLPIVVSVQKGSDVAPDEVRRAVSGELGAPVVLAEEATDAVPGARSATPSAAAGGWFSPGPRESVAGPGWLEVDSRNGVLRLVFHDARGRRIEREITAPADGAARVRTIALLAGNLARNEADDFAPKETTAARSSATAPGAQDPSDIRSAEPCSKVQVCLAPGDELDVRVRHAESAGVAAEASGATSAVAQTEARLPPRPAADGSVQRTLGWIGISTGVASLGTGVALAIMAHDKESAVLRLCTPSNVCAPAGMAAYQSAKVTAVESNVAFGVGAVLALAGTVLEITAPHASSASIALGPGGISVSRSW
jgi:hypothetical protein